MLKLKLYRMKSLNNKDALSYGELDDELWTEIQKYRTEGALVLCMGAGTIDPWVRGQLN
jgi:UDP-N-acetylmuramate-alanine ligase